MSWPPWRRAPNQPDISPLEDRQVATEKLQDDSVTKEKIGPSAVTTAGLADRNVTRDKLALGAIGMPIGSVFWASYSAPDPGCLACQGQSLLRSDYPALFAKIGTTWGAADGTHFSLPELRDRIPIGAGDIGALGTRFGSATYDLGHVHASAAHAHSHSHADDHYHRYSKAHDHGLQSTTDAGAHSHGGRTQLNNGNVNNGVYLASGSFQHDHNIDTSTDHHHDLDLSNYDPGAQDSEQRRRWADGILQSTTDADATSTTPGNTGPAGSASQSIMPPVAALVAFIVAN
jgi:microcystin-dependent protein